MASHEPSPTPRYRSVLADASEQARRLGHEYVGVEHLMLAILGDGQSVAAHALERVGVELPALDAELRALIASYSG